MARIRFEAGNADSTFRGTADGFQVIVDRGEIGKPRSVDPPLLGGAFSPTDRKTLANVAKTCRIHKTPVSNPEIAVTVAGKTCAAAVRPAVGTVGGLT